MCVNRKYERKDFISYGKNIYQKIKPADMNLFSRRYNVYKLLHRNVAHYV